MLTLIAGQYAFVEKVEVSNMDQSVDWYTSKLDLVVDPRFTSNPSWRQLNMPGLPRVAMGLSATTHTPSSGGAVATFVVADIQAARQTLIDRGVDVSPIQDVGQGVLLAFFNDPDGNGLGLRQNSPSEPGPAEVGWQS